MEKKTETNRWKMLSIILLALVVILILALFHIQTPTNIQIVPQQTNTTEKIVDEQNNITSNELVKLSDEDELLFPYIFSEQEDLKNGWSQFYYLYSPDFYEYTELESLEVEIDIKSDQYFGTIIVPNADEYENFLDGNNYKYVERDFSVKFYNKNITAYPGYGIIVWANRKYMNYEITLTYPE